MAPALRAGLCYFAVVFAAGFVLGAVRELVLLAILGSTLAIVLEVPVMLPLSWLVCAWLVRRFSVPPSPSARITMGAVAFLLLIAAETVLGVVGFGRSLTEQLQTYRALGPALGLVAQIAFAAFPLIQATKAPG